MQSFIRFFVASLLFSIVSLCSFSALAQIGGGWGGFPIQINNVTIIQPNSCVVEKGQQSTGSMLIDISIGFGASLPSTVFVGWEDARGEQYGQMATVTQPPFISYLSVGQVLITGLAQGMTIVGIQVIPKGRGGFQAGASAIYTSPTFPVTINTLLCITSVTPEQITQCNANNGKLTVVLTNGVQGTNYDIDLQNGGVSVATRTVVCNNNTLVINDLSPITVDKIVITDNQHREANYNLSYSWQNPPSPQIISVVPTPAVCDGLGSLEIILGNATDVANNSFTVKLNGNTFATNVNLSGSSLIVSNIHQNFVLSSVQVSTSNTLCSSNFYALTPAFTYPITKLLLGNIIPTNPEKCNSSGSLLIYLQNGVNGREYDVVLNNGTQILRKTLFGGALTLGNQNIFGAEYFYGGYSLQQVRVKDVVTNCEVSQNFSYTFQNPTFNITGFSKLEPQNQCGAKGTLTLQVPNSARRHYIVKLYGSINKNNFTSWMSTEQPYGNDNNELIMTGFGNGTVISGISEVYDVSSECWLYPSYQFTPAVTFNNLRTNPEIIGTQFINPTSCNGTGYFNFFINTQTAYPAWNSNGEDVKVEISSSQGYTSSIVFTNYNIYSPQYSNGTTISGVIITRLSTGCVARWDNRFTFQSPDLPVIFQTRQHNYTKCNEPMEMDIQLASPNSTDTYNFVDAFTGISYIGTRLADGWYHVKKPFLQEGNSINFNFLIKNETTGCSNYQSGYLSLQKMPPLTMTTATLTQPEKCQTKGVIKLEGYMFLPNEPYEIWFTSNGVVTLFTTQSTSSVNTMFIEVPEGQTAITKIELRGKNTCTPAILATNLPLVKNNNPFKIITATAINPTQCDGMGGVTLYVVGAELNRNYLVRFTANRVVADFTTQQSGGGYFYVNNYIPDGTAIEKIELIDTTNPSCKSLPYICDPKLIIASPNKPIILQVVQNQLTCNTWNLGIRVHNGIYPTQITITRPNGQISNVYAFSQNGLYMFYENYSSQPMVFTSADNISNITVTNTASQCSDSWTEPITFVPKTLVIATTMIQPSTGASDGKIEIKLSINPPSTPPTPIPDGNYTITYSNLGVPGYEKTVSLQQGTDLITLTGFQAGDEVCITGITTTATVCPNNIEICELNFNSAPPCDIIADDVADKNKNWIKTTTFGFDKGNVAQRLSESKSFFNTAGTLLQSQSKDFANCVIWATEPLFDKQNRVIGQTMPGLIQEFGFKYQPDFVVNPDESKYTWRNFENDGVVGSKKNTLGWYYSNKNDKEDYTAKTDFPYSRLEYYNNGTSEVKRSAAPGDEFRMGKGHETMSKSFPVSSELDEYVAWRNNILTTSATTLAKQATKTVGRDVNGKEAVVFADKTGKTLASAIFEGNAGENPLEKTLEYQLDLPFYWVNIELATKKPNLAFETVNTVTVTGNVSHVQIFDNYTGAQIYIGKLTDINPKTLPTYVDKNSKYQIRSVEKFTIQTEHIKKNTYEQYPNGQVDPIYVTSTHTSIGKYTPTQNPRITSVDFHIPKAQGAIQTTLTNQTGVVPVIKNLENGAAVSTTLLQGGFYAITMPKYEDLFSYPYKENYVAEKFSYNYKLYNLSYTFYNDASAVLASMSPNGVAQMRKGLENGQPFATVWTGVDKSTAKYNSMGMVLEQTETDAGTTRYIYAKDGRIRFSQSAKQRLLGRISFTDYDEWLRPFRSSEASTNNFSWELLSSPIMTELTGYSTAWVNTEPVITTGYDFADENSPRHNTQPQTWTVGQVSWTEKWGVSKTWYSYDDMGRVLWTVQKLNFELGNNTVYKSLDYEYDNMGNVLAVVYQKGTTEAFTHRFEYDRVYRLSRVYTQDYGKAEKLLAHYQYYYHGGLKRVETGNNLQGTDYVYTLQGWLKSINGLDKSQDPGNDGTKLDANNVIKFAPDAFGMVLQYYQNDYKSVKTTTMATVSSTATDLYNGSITTNSWAYGNNDLGNSMTEKRAYAYTYDHKYQLKDANYKTVQGVQQAGYNFANLTTLQDFSEGGLTYDLNGNIKTLTRKNGDNPAVTNLMYSYHEHTVNGGVKYTNKLKAVTGRSTNYDYDEIGQLIEETREGSEVKKLKLTYDVTGKVTEVRDASGALKVRFNYDEKGQRMEKINYTSGIHTWYISDAGGKTVRIYEKKQSPLTPEGGILKEETPLYGMSRIGMLSKVFDEQLHVKQDYIYEVKDHLGNVRVTYNEVPKFGDKKYTMTAETEQHYLADRDDYLNFANTNYWRSIDKSYIGNNATSRFSLKISPIDNQPMPQPQKVSMFRLPIRKGEKWSAKVWAFKALNPGIAGQKSPLTEMSDHPKGGISTSKTPPSGIGGLFTLVTPIIIPNLGNQSTENQGLSFNVLAAVPIVKSIFKGLKPQTKLSGGSKPPDNYANIGDFGTERVGQTNTAYLLVELLDEKNNVIQSEHKKVLVTSQNGWQVLAIDEQTVNLQNECTQAGILRFSLVNDTDYNIWFDDFEITHKQGDEKINVTSWTDYYPYGKVAKTSCPSNGAYRYGYQGEFAEKEEEWNSFELRQYDSEIGRFLSVDPMGEFWSSYVGMGNDPVNLTDPTGGCTDCPDNDPPAGWGQGYMIDEVVVTPQTSNIIANNQAFMQQMADFNSKYVPKPELPIRYSMGSPSTGAIEQSYPEEFLMPDIPILWVVGKFGKAALKYGVKTAGFGSSILSRVVSNKQFRHIKDHPDWIRDGSVGGYLNSKAEAQQVLDAVHSGEARFLGLTPQGHSLYHYTGVTGFNNNIRAGFIDQPTNVFLLKGFTSPSIVPTDPTRGL